MTAQALADSSSEATAQPVRADGPIRMETIAPHLSFHIDEGWRASLPELAAHPSAFAPMRLSEPDFGYTKHRIWLRFTVLNDTGKERSWRLHFHENFMQYMAVWTVDPDGRTEQVLALDSESPFAARPIAYPEMVAPFVLQPGEATTIYIAYWSQGSSHLSFSLETEDSFVEVTLARMSRNFIYYGMVVVCILTALLAWVLMRKSVFIAFIAYASSTLLYLMHADGVAFQYLWPNAPRFNSMASVVTGGAFMVFSALYARVFLQLRTPNRLVDRVLLAVAAIAFLVTMSVFVFDPQWVKRIMIPSALLVIVACVSTGIYVARYNFRGVRFYLLAWFGAALSSAIMNLRHVFGVEWTQDFEFDSMRAALVFDAMMMGLAIFEQFAQMRRSRQVALQKSLSDATRNLDLTRRLGELEQRYMLVTELAKAHSAKVADTIHDLRQPLHALRHKVTSLANSQIGDEADIQRIGEAFAYLEGLLAREMEDALTAEDRTAREAGIAASDSPGVQETLRSVYEMFVDDARAKGLELRLFAGSGEAPVDPLVLMRVVSNLVSNAVKYTPKGRVLIGTRQIGGWLRIEVHDTGPGLNAQEFEAAMQRAIRLERDRDAAIGSGLGLAIVCDLAQRHGLTVELAKRRTSGTSILVSLNRTVLHGDGGAHDKAAQGRRAALI